MAKKVVKIDEESVSKEREAALEIMKRIVEKESK